MRHLNAGRKLGVGPDHRTALLRSMTLALIERDHIRLPLSRAKALRWHADHVVTLAKRGDLHSRRQIISLLGCSISGNSKNRVRSVIGRIYTDLVPRFKSRAGGYTQILKVSERRRGDNAEMCIMRYIPDEQDSKSSKKASKKQATADQAPKVKKTAKAQTPEDGKPTKLKTKKISDKPT